MHKLSIGVLLILTITGCSDFAIGIVPAEDEIEIPENWYIGGTLHDATFEQWVEAEQADKLATCADWLTEASWEEYLITEGAYNQMFYSASLLLEFLDIDIDDGIDSSKSVRATAHRYIEPPSLFFEYEPPTFWDRLFG